MPLASAQNFPSAHPMHISLASLSAGTGNSCQACQKCEYTPWSCGWPGHQERAFAGGSLMFRQPRGFSCRSPFSPFFRHFSSIPLHREHIPDHFTPVPAGVPARVLSCTLAQTHISMALSSQHSPGLFKKNQKTGCCRQNNRKKTFHEARDWLLNSLTNHKKTSSPDPSLSRA